MKNTRKHTNLNPIQKKMIKSHTEENVAGTLKWTAVARGKRYEKGTSVQILKIDDPRVKAELGTQLHADEDSDFIAILPQGESRPFIHVSRGVERVVNEAD